MSSTSKAASGSSDQKKPRQDITKNKGKVGDWVRHTSSSGKEYYYNVISHASQWEKPREWLDHEQRYGPVPNVPAGSSRAQPTTIAKVQQQHTSATQSQQQHDRERDREHHHQLHQQQQREREQAQRDRYHHHQHQHPGPSTSSNYTHAWTAAVAHHQHHNIHSSSSSTVSTSSSRHYTETRQLPTSSAALSSNHGVRDSRKPSEDMQSEDMDISPLDEESSVTIDTSGAGRSQSQQPASNMSTIISGPSTTTYGNRNSERERERERDRDRDREKERDDRDRDSYRGSISEIIENVVEESDSTSSLSSSPVISLTSKRSSLLFSKIIRGSQLQQDFLMTGSKELDMFLNGGIPTFGITEICGISGSGKTQFCLQLSLMAQLPLVAGGLGSGTLFISTEQIFPSQRLAELIRHFRSKFSNNSENPLNENLMDQIYVERIGDVEALQSCLDIKAPALLREKKIRLIVIDSLAALFRADYEMNEMSKRTADLRLIGSSYHIRDRDRDRLRGDTRDSPRRDIDRYRERDRNDRDRGGDRNDRGRGRERDREREWEKDRRDRSRSKLRDERSRSPQWDKDRTPERQGDSSSMSLGSIDTAKKEDIPDLPSSMAVYFREDLISHVKNLPGDALERQANKLMEELLTINSVQLSKVSSELKMARSLVRLTDIQSTLQEQKILFLRQQIKDLEDSESSTCLGIDMPNL